MMDVEKEHKRLEQFQIIQSAMNECVDKITTIDTEAITTNDAVMVSKLIDSMTDAKEYMRDEVDSTIKQAVVELINLMASPTEAVDDDLP